MEWLSSFAGSNGIPILIFAVIFLATSVLLVKKGILSFNGKGIRLGQDVQTRSLIQAQFEYTNAKCESVIGKLPQGLDVYRTKWIISRAEDIIQRAIIFNNMNESDTYIHSKQELVYAAVLKRADNDYFKTDEFKKFCFEFVKDLIRDLVKMKDELN